MVESTREPSPHTLVHRVTPSNSLLLFTPFTGVVLWWCYVIVAVFHSCGLVVKKHWKKTLPTSWLFTLTGCSPCLFRICMCLSKAVQLCLHSRWLWQPQYDYVWRRKKMACSPALLWLAKHLQDGSCLWWIRAGRLCVLWSVWHPKPHAMCVCFVFGQTLHILH